MFGLLFASCRSYLNRKQSRIDKKLRHLASISDNLDFLAACSLPEVRHTEQGILNTSSEFIQCLPEKLGQENEGGQFSLSIFKECSVTALHEKQLCRIQAARQCASVLNVLTKGFVQYLGSLSALKVQACMYQ